MLSDLKKYLGIFVLTVFVFYFWFNKEDFRPLLTLDWQIILALLAINTVVIFINGLIFREYFKVFEKNISHFESFDLSLTSSIANLFVPMKAGAMVRAVYFKEKYGLAYSKFAGLLISTYVIQLFILSLLGSMVLVLIGFEESRLWILRVVLLGILLMCSLLIYVKIPSVEKLIPESLKQNWLVAIFHKYFEKFLSGWSVLIQNKAVLTNLFLLSLLNFFLIAFCHFLELKALGYKLNLVNLLVFSTISGLSFYLSITPSAIGIRESMLIIFSQVLILPAAVIINASVIDRAAIYILLFAVYLIQSVRKRFWSSSYFSQ